MDRQRAIEDGARRGGALHRHRQPVGEGHLSTLPHGGKHQQQADHGGGGGRHEAVAVGPGSAEQPLEIARSHRPMHHHAGRQQADVADPVGDEGPHRRLGRIRAILEKSDQQRRGNAEEFPPGKQHVDAACQHHQVHAGAKQSQQEKEAGEAGLAMEILAGKGIDQGAQTGREADVGHRQTIGHQIDRGLVVAHGKPGPQMHRLRGKAPQR